MVGHKSCCECQRTLPIALFHKDNTRATGYSSKCRTCLKQARIARGTYKRPKPYVAQSDSESERIGRELALTFRRHGWPANRNARFGVPSIGVAA